MISLRLFGSLDLRGDDGLELRAVLQQPKRAALLAFLASTGPGTFHRRDSLLAMFWPDLDEARARDALNSAVRFLRRSMGNEVLVSRGDEELGLAPDRVWADAPAFDEAVRHGRHEEALGLYRGELLAGFHWR